MISNCINSGGNRNSNSVRGCHSTGRTCTSTGTDTSTGTTTSTSSPGLWPRGVLELVLSTSFLGSFHHFSDEIRLTLVSLWEKSIFKEIENRAATEAKSMFLKNIMFFPSPDARWGYWEGLSAGLPGEPWELITAVFASEMLHIQ